MSNDSLALPAHLQNNEEAAKRALLDAQSMSSASNSVPRISLRGREFRFVENGEEIRKVRDKIRVIILGVEPEARAMIKTWYKDGYKSGAKEPPTCSSDNGVTPSPWVQDRQSATCANCPKNQFGSATSPSGKATKACRDSKRIWVVEAETFESGAWKPVTEPINERTQYGLSVTVASLKSFSELGRMLAGYNQSPCVAVTELEMLDKEFPELKFNLVGWLDAENTPKSLEINQKRPWKMYSSSALALESSSSGSATQLPMSPPAHLQAKPTAPSATVADVQIKHEAPSNQSIDDAIGNW